MTDLVTPHMSVEAVMSEVLTNFFWHFYAMYCAVKVTCISRGTAARWTARFVMTDLPDLKPSQTWHHLWWLTQCKWLTLSHLNVRRLPNALTLRQNRPGLAG